MYPKNGQVFQEAPKIRINCLKFPALFQNYRFACYAEGHAGIFRLALNCGDYDARTPFHLAAAEGRLEVVDYLLSVGAQINIRDRWNGTPLAGLTLVHFSAQRKHFVWDRGCMKGLFKGCSGGVQGVFRGA